MEKRTQDEAVLDWLKFRGGLTQETARDELGVWRLSAVILRLKKKGNLITSKDVQRPSRYGNGTATVSEYHLATAGSLFHGFGGAR